MRTGLLAACALWSVALAIPTPQDPSTDPTANSTTTNSTASLASPEATPIAITFENAQSNPSGVADAILAEVNAEIAANETSSGLSTAAISADAATGVASDGFFGHGGKGGKGGGGGSGVGGGPPNSPLNVLLAAVGKFPIFNKEFKVIGDILTGIEAKLAAALGVDTTQTDTACKALTVIFARGTTEPGNVGLVTGPPFFDALRGMLGSNQVAVRGVEYGATIEGFLEGGEPDGGRDMAAQVTNTLATCPKTAIVMSGYSQGGQVVHNAANLLGPAVMARVSSVVIFGDPDFGTAVTGARNQKIICHPDDAICKHEDLILLAHLTYSENAQEAATFAAASAGIAIGNP